jgi:hypothetical protein
MRNAFNIFVEKSEGKKPLGRSRRRWEDNVRMDLREIGWEVWASCCEHGHEPSGSVKDREFFD